MTVFFEMEGQPKTRPSWKALRVGHPREQKPKSWHEASATNPTGQQIPHFVWDDKFFWLEPKTQSGATMSLVGGGLDGFGGVFGYCEPFGCWGA
jgi:hypothetical protein